MPSDSCSQHRCYTAGCPDCRSRAAERARRRRATLRPQQWAAYLAAHAGHVTVVTSNNRLRCVSCWRGDLDVDEVAVRRAVAGDRPEQMSPAEIHAAVVALTRSGVTVTESARRLRVRPQTVTRHVEHARKEGELP